MHKKATLQVHKDSKKDTTSDVRTGVFLICDLPPLPRVSADVASVTLPFAPWTCFKVLLSLLEAGQEALCREADRLLVAEEMRFLQASLVRPGLDELSVRPQQTGPCSSLPFQPPLGSIA